MVRYTWSPATDGHSPNWGIKASLFAPPLCPEPWACYHQHKCSLNPIDAPPAHHFWRKLVYCWYSLFHLGISASPPSVWGCKNSCKGPFSPLTPLVACFATDPKPTTHNWGILGRLHFASWTKFWLPLSKKITLMAWSCDRNFKGNGTECFQPLSQANLFPFLTSPGINSCSIGRLPMFQEASNCEEDHKTYTLFSSRITRSHLQNTRWTIAWCLLLRDQEPKVQWCTLVRKSTVTTAAYL